MLKRFVSLCLIGLLALTIAFSAVSADTLESQEDEVLGLSLEQAQKLAIENNPKVKLAELGLENAKLAEEQVESALDKLEALDELGMKPTDFDTKIQEKVGQQQVEMGVKLADIGLKLTKRQIKMAVESAYYAALQADVNLEIYKRSMETAEKQLEFAKLEKQVGTASDFEVLEVEVKKAQAEADYKNALRDRDIAYIKLKQTIGIDLDKPIELTTSFEYEPLEDMNLDDAISQALDNRLEMVRAKEELAVAEAELKVAESYYTPNVFKYREKMYAVEEKKAALKEQEDAVRLEVIEAYLNMQAAEDGYKVLVKAEEQAKETLRLAELRREAGLVRPIDVMQVETSLKQVQLSKAKALHGYNLAKAQFKNAIGEGLK